MDGSQGLPQTPTGCLATLGTGLDDVLFERTAYSGDFMGLISWLLCIWGVEVGERGRNLLPLKPPCIKSAIQLFHVSVPEMSAIKRCL